MCINLIASSYTPIFKQHSTFRNPIDLFTLRADHYMWFIVTVVQNNMLTSLWSELEWKKGIDNARAAFKVLYFLKSSYYIMEQHPPGYSPSHLSGDGSC